jgi:hypothetical protein
VRWTVEYAPPQMYGFFRLAAISPAPGSDDVWAVGDASGPVMIAHGGSQPWGYVSYPPNLLNMPMNDIVAFKPDEICIVGSTPYWDYELTYIAFFDGNAWDRVASPNADDGLNQLLERSGWPSGPTAFPRRKISGRTGAPGLSTGRTWTGGSPSVWTSTSVATTRG